SIISSAPYLGSWLAASGRRYSRSSGGLQRWKWLAYYELIHRTGKKIVLTAGLFGEFSGNNMVNVGVEIVFFSIFFQIIFIQYSSFSSITPTIWPFVVD